MKKKVTHKKNIHKNPHFTHLYKIIFILSLIIAIALSGKVFSGVSKPHVLGSSTMLLADKGTDDSGTSGGQDSGGSGSGGTSGGNTSSSGSSSQGSSNFEGTETSGGGSSGLTNSTITQDTTIDCVGPDGKHFTTSFHDCQELNQKWGKQNFSFTPLSTPQKNEQENAESVSPTPEQENETPELPKTIEAETEGNKSKIKLQTQGLTLEIKKEDGGKLTIKAHQNGGEVELSSDSLDSINEALQSQEIEISTTSADTLGITSHEVTAHTQFPLSIDTETNTLAITTPAGTKDVTVLPDKAVENITQSHILSSVLSESQTESSHSAKTIISLTTLNNQPVFAIQGVKEKHLLGIFPIGFQKTVTVSAQTGQVLSTQENLLNRILELFSL